MAGFIKHTKDALKSLFIAVIIVLVLLPYCAIKSSADTSIYLTLSGPTSEIHAGDVATVTVTASKFEHITRFGPIDLAYNSDSIEYVSIWPVTELSAFSYTVDYSTPGHFIVSAVDQAVESDMAAAQASGDFEDNSVNRDSEVVLFTISFRVTSANSSNIRFWIDSASGFRDTSMNEISSSIGDGITIEVAPSLSNDASLSEISINNVTLSPEFDPEVLEYSATVGRDVSALEINAISGNLWATIDITGDNNLSFGENIVVITVVAQDGQTSRQYRLYVTRQDDSVSGGSGFVDAFGKTFTFIDFPTNFEIPTGFQEDYRTINGYNVSVLVREGLSSYLIYAYDGEHEPSWYFYNPNTKITTRYTANSFVIQPSRILSACKVPEIVQIPEGFSDSIMEFEGVNIAGYSNEDGVFIAYLKDEEGNAEFYRYDEITGRFVDYKSVDRTSEKIFSVLFYIFLVMTLLESIAIVVIVIIVRRVIVARMRPKPRRV